MLISIYCIENSIVFKCLSHNDVIFSKVILSHTPLKHYIYIYDCNLQEL